MNHRPISIFYHLFQGNDWRSLYNEQIQALRDSGLYSVADKIHVGVNGNQLLPSDPKIQSHFNKNTSIEADTLKSLHEYCVEHPSAYVLYFHSKGVSRTGEMREIADSWRLYMEHFLFHHWKVCHRYLDEYDAVGVEYRNNATIDNPTNRILWGPWAHYSGNFWWARASYITSLDVDYLYQNIRGQRWLGELWIGTQSGRLKSLCQMVNQYCPYMIYPKEKYVNLKVQYRPYDHWLGETI